MPWDPVAQRWTATTQPGGSPTAVPGTPQPSVWHANQPDNLGGSPSSGLWGNARTTNPDGGPNPAAQRGIGLDPTQLFAGGAQAAAGFADAMTQGFLELFFNQPRRENVARGTTEALNNIANSMNNAGQTARRELDAASQGRFTDQNNLLNAQRGAFDANTLLAQIAPLLFGRFNSFDQNGNAIRTVDSNLNSGLNTLNAQTDQSVAEQERLMRGDIDRRQTTVEQDVAEQERLGDRSVAERTRLRDENLARRRQGLTDALDDQDRNRQRTTAEIHANLSNTIADIDRRLSVNLEGIQGSLGETLSSLTRSVGQDVAQARASTQAQFQEGVREIDATIGQTFGRNSPQYQQAMQNLRHQQQVSLGTTQRQLQTAYANLRAGEIRHSGDLRSQMSSFYDNMAAGARTSATTDITQVGTTDMGIRAGLRNAADSDMTNIGEGAARDITGLRGQQTANIAGMRSSAAADIMNRGASGASSIAGLRNQNNASTSSLLGQHMATRSAEDSYMAGVEANAAQFDEAQRQRFNDIQRGFLDNYYSEQSTNAMFGYQAQVAADQFSAAGIASVANLWLGAQIDPAALTNSTAVMSNVLNTVAAFRPAPEPQGRNPMEYITPIANTALLATNLATR